MNDVRRPVRFAPPLMQAFRASFRAKDAKKIIEERDESGDRIVAGRRSGWRRATNETTLRQELNEDLVSLLNTVNLGSSEDIAEFEFVAKSILNYGLADLTTITIDELAVEDIGEELGTTLIQFEPRLAANSIEIERDRSVDPSSLNIRFNIRAEMRATPLDVPVSFVADLDMESAKMRISRLAP